MALTEKLSIALDKLRRLDQKYHLKAQQQKDKAIDAAIDHCDFEENNHRIMVLESEIANITNKYEYVQKLKEREKNKMLQTIEALNEKEKQLTYMRQIDQANATAEKNALKEQISELETYIKSNEARKSKLSSRFKDMEKELVQTKLKLAESETSKDQLLTELRQRYESLEENLKYYKEKNMELELKINGSKKTHLRVFN